MGTNFVYFHFAGALEHSDYHKNEDVEAMLSNFLVQRKGLQPLVSGGVLRHDLRWTSS